MSKWDNHQNHQSHCEPIFVGNGNLKLAHIQKEYVVVAAAISRNVWVANGTAYFLSSHSYLPVVMLSHVFDIDVSVVLWLMVRKLLRHIRNEIRNSWRKWQFVHP